LSNPSSSMSQKELSEAPLNCCHLALLDDELLCNFVISQNRGSMSLFPGRDNTGQPKKLPSSASRFHLILFYSSYRGHHSSVKFYPTFERPPKRIHSWPRPTFPYQLPHLQTRLMIMNCEFKEHLRDIELYLNSPHNAVLPFADQPHQRCNRRFGKAFSGDCCITSY
jgi:hypothetical protein